MQSLQDIANWKNPVYDITDPLKQRFAEIVQTMNTHIYGICPIHIYVNRRPVESENPYALLYRVLNFQPLTKEAFDRALAGFIQVSKDAQVKTKLPDYISNNTFEIRGRELRTFCFEDLLRLRESDPNAVILPLPKVKRLEDGVNVSITGIDFRFVNSVDIDKFDVAKNYIRFVGGVVKFPNDAVEYKYYFVVSGGQYTVEFPDKTTKQLVAHPIVLLNNPLPAFKFVSNNVVIEGKYSLRLPYLLGAAAWGDKFYGQESDFTIQAARHTYVKEIRAKERCEQQGHIFDPASGVHVQASDPSKVCPKCKGGGYVKDDSPLGVMHVDFDKLTADGKSLPDVIRFAEPPQSPLQTSMVICDTYYERMSDSLGLVKQNTTNASAVSREFDYRDKEAIADAMFEDSRDMLEYCYQCVEVFMLQSTRPISIVKLVGELGKATVKDLLTEWGELKKGGAPPVILEAVMDKILRKSLPGDVADTIIAVAHTYDKLYTYSRDDLMTAKALLGTQVTERMVYIHDTVIGVILDYLKQNGGDKKADEIIKYLNEYYDKAMPAPPNPTPGAML